MQTLSDKRAKCKCINMQKSEADRVAWVSFVQVIKGTMQNLNRTRVLYFDVLKNQIDQES